MTKRPSADLPITGEAGGGGSPSAAAAARTRRHLGIGTLLAMAAQIAPLAASGGLGLIVARLDGASGAGSLSLVVNLFDTALLVFAIGLPTGITYLVSRAEWPLGRATAEANRAAAWLGGAGVLCGLGFYALTRHSVFRGVQPVLVVVALAGLVFALSWTFSGAIALGRDHYEAYAGLRLIQAGVVLTLAIGLTAAFGLVGGIVGFTVSNVLASAYGQVWLRRSLRAERRQHHPPRASPVPDADGGQLRRATRFGLQAWSANLLQLLNYRLDIFLLGAVAGRAPVGVYQIAVSVTALGWVLPDAFQTVLFPRVADLDAAVLAGEISSEASDASAARAMRHSVLLAVPTAVALVVAVLLVPLVYGSGFDHAVLLGCILIPGVVVVGIAKVMSAVVTGRGFPRYALFATMITVPVTVGLYFALIPPFHAVGAAVASSISYLITMALSLPILRRATPITLREALIPTRSDLADYASAFRLARSRLHRA